MELSRQEYWRRSPFPIPGDLPVSGIEHTSCESPAWAGGFLTIAPLRNTRVSMFLHITVQGFSLQIPPRTQGRGQTRMKGTVFSVHLFPLSYPQPWGLEKEMATHSSILSWEIPWTEEPGGLQSTGSQKVGHSWVHTHTHTHRYTPLWGPHCTHQLLLSWCKVGPAMIGRPWAWGRDGVLRWGLGWETRCFLVSLAVVGVYLWINLCIPGLGVNQTPSALNVQKAQTPDSQST